METEDNLDCGEFLTELSFEILLEYLAMDRLFELLLGGFSGYYQCRSLPSGHLCPLEY